MARPITKADVKIWRERYSAARITIKKYEMLGITIIFNTGLRGHRLYSYAADGRGDPIWVCKATILKRARIGRPKKRPKLIMREPDFGLDEMALAEHIMAGE